MVTVHRETGLRIVIYTQDHQPAHVHVYGDGDCKIDLCGDTPKLLRVNGMSKTDVRRALRIVGEQREVLLERWNDIHG